MIDDDDISNVICLSCDNQEFRVEEKTYGCFYYEQWYDVKACVYVCQKCGTDVMSTAQMRELRLKLREAFEKRKIEDEKKLKKGRKRRSSHE